MILFELLLCCLGRMFWVIVMLEDLSTTHFQCSHWGKEVVAQNFPVLGPIHPPLDTVKLSCPLSWETPSKHKVSTSMVHSGDGALGVLLSISLPPNTASQVDANWLYFGLIWPHHLLPSLLRIIQVFFGKLQTGLYMCRLQQRNLAHAAGF